MVLNTPRFPKSRGIVFCLNFWYYLSIKYKEDSILMPNRVITNFTYNEVEEILNKAKNNYFNGNYTIKDTRDKFINFLTNFGTLSEEAINIFLNLNVLDFTGCLVSDTPTEYVNDSMYVFLPNGFELNGERVEVLIYTKFAFELDSDGNEITTIISIHPAKDPMPYVFK